MSDSPFRIPAMTLPKLPDVFGPLVELGDMETPAESAQDSLATRIRAFEARLGADEEMAIQIMGTPVAFRLTGIGTDGGGLVIFYGEDGDGRKVEAYQHFTQTNLSLMAVAKPADIEARRMGFDTPPASGG